ncbi:MAG: translocation/assembly module TamB domain-containing protein [Rudaea sp.]|nr:MULTISPECIES: translocation/assembly module TamB domain-containing protein [unclassified Rudaea]MBN8888557.1 translocation/assembly module TamB domain-containing protein [Rudaea sp.]
MKKWLKRIGIALAIVFALILALAWWLLATESGTRFAVERAKSALAGKLAIAQATGALTSPLELHDVAYKDPASGLDVKVKTLKLDYEFFGLLRKTAHVRSLDIDGVDVALTTVPATPPPPDAAKPSVAQLLTPPLDILLDRLHVGTVHVTQDGKPVFASDSLDAAATWTASALTVKQLALRAPDGKVDLDGAITRYADVVGAGKLDLDWAVPNQSDVAGAEKKSPPMRVAAKADFNNDGKQAHFVLALSQPLVANAKGSLTPNDKNLPWTVDLDVPGFDPKTLTQSDALKTLALKLAGSGDKNAGALSGSVDLNQHRILLDPLKFASDGKTFTLEPLRLRSPEAPGTLTAQAKVHLDAKPVGGDVKLDWADVVLPADLAGQEIATHGSISAGGNADKFNAQGELSIGPPKQIADLAFKLDGTPEKISLAQLELKQPKGGLNATGDVVLKPKVGWNIEAKANRLDPGAFAKDWPGAVNFILSTSGNVEKDGPVAKLKLDGLSGTLRQRALGGNGDLSFAPPLNVDGKLNLSSGQSTVAIVGKGGAGKDAPTDLKIDLGIASLGDWVPKAGGSIRGTIAVNGPYPKLNASGKVTGSAIVSGDTHLQAFTLDFDAKDLSAPSGNLALDARTLSAAGYTFDTVKLDANGNQAAHRLRLDVNGKPLSLALALDGALTQTKTASDWRGTLRELTLNQQGLPEWKLAQPTALSYVGGSFNLSELCLRAGAPGICAQATQDAKSGTNAKFSIEHLPLAMLAKFASPDAPLKLEGEINGNGAITAAPSGALSGNAAITSDQGTITYPDSASKGLLSYKGFRIDAALSPAQNTITIAGDLNDGGRIDGRIVTGAAAADGAMPLSGNLGLNINSLSFVDLLTTQVSGTKGKVEAKFALSGTTKKPGIDGQLALVDFGTEVPAAGLKLRDGNISVRSRDGENFDIDGAIASDEGKLALKGSAGIAPDSPIALSIQGDRFLAANIPGAKVYISPDLKIDRDAKRLRVGGTLQIPQMFVDVSKLPGGGAAVAPSPDIVVVDDKAAQKSAAANAPIEVEVTVKLGAGEKLAMDLRQGTEVHLIGFGLNANLGGQLTVIQLPGKTPIGRGQIQVNGTFKAYGQDLTIEQGRLLFAGTPVENPGLDIRATRGFPDQNIVVGLQVRGTAVAPQLTVFSTPAMEQSDALSYLVAGKPLSQLKGGEGNAVGSAASALGTAGGDLLAKSIGAKMGLDDVGVADNSSVGGAALTVGKYLSPRLYMSYGVGLFSPGQVVTLRYKLTRLFDFEMQNGTLSSRAGINYRIEK